MHNPHTYEQVVASQPGAPFQTKILCFFGHCFCLIPLEGDRVHPTVILRGRSTYTRSLEQVQSLAG